MDNDTIFSPGHFSDRTFFATPVVVRFSSLLSVINIDSLIVCLQVTHLSFILLLCSGKLPLRCAENIGLCNKKRNGHHPTPLPIILTNLISNKTSVETSLFPYCFSCSPLSEHIRYVHATAKAPVLAAVTIGAYQFYNTTTPRDLASLRI